MWIIELWRTTHYGAFYHGYYHSNAYDHFCTDANHATVLSDKVEADCMTGSMLAVEGFRGWNRRLLKVT